MFKLNHTQHVLILNLCLTYSLMGYIYFSFSSVYDELNAFNNKLDGVNLNSSQSFSSTVPESTNSVEPISQHILFEFNNEGAQPII